MKVELIISAEESITAEGLQNSTTSLVPPGAILIVVRSGILKHTIPAAINKVEVALNQDMKALRFDPKLAIGKFFLRWIQGFNDQLLHAWLKQGATVESIEQDYLSDTTIPLPDFSEQRKIVNFLDHETARIDALIEEQQRLIELLKEKRQAIISHAVTKGLDPTVPKKDSGVEWLAEVPAHWVVIKLGLVTSERCDGPFGSALKSDHYTDEGVRVIRLQNIKSGWFNNTDSAFIDSEYFFSSINKSDVLPGDVLIAGLGDEKNPVGRACVAPGNLGSAMVKADCFRFRLLSDVALSKFVALQLTSGAVADAGRLSTGSTRSRIPLSSMSTRLIALPPIAEQKAVIEFVQEIDQQLDSLFSEAKCGIELLQERRSALISAAVTGKIDVRGWQPPTTAASPELAQEAV
ncbi:hypothetical protein A1348_24915 [Pseudomonas protegens]|nr:hypothetical protein A1348_24915 [Pseudomonas protegens]